MGKRVKHIMAMGRELFKEGNAATLDTLKSDRMPWVVFYFASITIAVFAVYSQVLMYPRFNPEWSLFYKWNSNLSLSQYWHWYHSFNSESGWYRPTSFVTFYQIVTPFIDWHNIYVFQIVGIVVLVINSYFVYCFTKQIFPDNITPILTSVLSLMHPVFYYLIYNLFMTDFLYQIFVLWFGIIYLGNYLGREKAYLWILTAFILYLLAVTSKEQSIGLPVFLVGAMALDVHFAQKTAGLRDKLLRNRLKLLLLTAIVTVVYVILYLKNHVLIDDGAYRTGLNYSIIVSNARSGLFWLSNIFLFNSSSWGEFAVNSTIYNNLYGGLVLTAVLLYVFFGMIKKNRNEIHKMLTAIFFAGAFIILPIYSGGRPWHYALPAIAVTMLYSRFISGALEKMPNRSFKMIGLGVVVIIPLVLSAINFPREMKQFDNIFFRLNTEALTNPPRLSQAIPEGSTIAYYPPGSKWLYGVGHLFSFVYKRSDITEVPVFSPDSISLDTAIKYLSKDDFFYFEYSQNRLPAWEDKTLMFKLRLLERLTPDQKSVSLLRLKEQYDSTEIFLITGERTKTGR